MWRSSFAPMPARREFIEVEIERHDQPTPAISRVGIATGLAKAIMAWGRSGVMAGTADRESSTNVPMDVVARYVREKSATKFTSRVPNKQLRRHVHTPCISVPKLDHLFDKSFPSSYFITSSCEKPSPPCPMTFCLQPLDRSRCFSWMGLWWVTQWPLLVDARDVPLDQLYIGYTCRA